MPDMPGRRQALGQIRFWAGEMGQALGEIRFYLDFRGAEGAAGKESGFHPPKVQDFLGSRRFSAVYSF